MTSHLALRRGDVRVGSEAWRLLLALTIGLAMWGSVFYTSVRLDRVPRWGEHWLWMDLTVGIIAGGLVLLRRRNRVAVAIAATLLSAISIVAIGPAAWSVVSLATTRRWRDVLLVVPLWFVAQWSSLEIYRAWETSGFWPNISISALSLLLCVAVGFYIGERRAYVDSLRERALTAEREQALRAVQARVAERTRIAREMHDVLAHRISLVAMHSGALAYRTDLPREQVAETAEVIRANANRALGELREVLGVLRDVPGTDGAGGADGSAAVPEAPQPTLAGLGELLTEARAAGGEVSAEIDGDVTSVPESTSRTAYRIVQEGLTNARKHAPTAPVHVAVAVVPDDAGQGTVSVTVRNGIRPGGEVVSSGLGLVGLTERAVLAGGELTYGPDGHGAWVVRARLPWST